jgi:hypothetical protein
VYAAQEAADGDVAGRIVHPAVPVRSRPFPDMKGHTSYLTFARRTRARSKSGVVDVVETNAPGLSTSCKTM